MSVYYIASLKINYFITQNLGNKAKPRDHDPPGYFRSQKYPGYEVKCIHDMCRMHSDFKKQHEIPHHSLVSSYICMQPQIMANPAQQFSYATCKQILIRIIIHFYRNCLFLQSVNMKI